MGRLVRGPVKVPGKKVGEETPTKSTMPDPFDRTVTRALLALWRHVEAVFLGPFFRELSIRHGLLFKLRF